MRSTDPSVRAVFLIAAVQAGGSERGLLAESIGPDFQDGKYSSSDCGRFASIHRRPEACRARTTATRTVDASPPPTTMSSAVSLERACMPDWLQPCSFPLEGLCS